MSLCRRDKEWVSHTRFLFPFSLMFWDRIPLVCFCWQPALILFWWAQTFYSVSLVQVKSLKIHIFICVCVYKSIYVSCKNCVHKYLCLKTSFSKLLFYSSLMQNGTSILNLLEKSFWTRCWSCGRWPELTLKRDDTASLPWTEQAYLRTITFYKQYHKCIHLSYLGVSAFLARHSHLFSYLFNIFPEFLCPYLIYIWMIILMNLILFKFAVIGLKDRFFL